MISMIYYLYTLPVVKVGLDQFNFEKVELRGARSLRLSFREPPKAGSFTKNADVTLML